MQFARLQLSSAVAASGRQETIVGAERDSFYAPVMPKQRRDRVACGSCYLPQAHRIVEAARRQPAAIRAERHRTHRLHVPAQHDRIAPRRRHIP